MDMHVRLHVVCSFSVTLGIDECSELEGDALKGTVARHIKNLIRDGALPDAIDKIEICELANTSDETLIRGTNG